MAAAPQAVAFMPGSDSQLVSVGAEACVYHWKITGALQTRAACSSPSAFSLATRPLDDGGCLAAVGGVGGTVDLFYDMSFSQFTVKCPAT